MISRRLSVGYWLGVRPWSRHGLVLVVGGLLYISLGASLLFYKPEESRFEALSLAREWMPLRYWSIVFIIVGILAILSARWPPMGSSWGYMVLTGLAAGWSAFYALGILFNDSPLSNISNALVWALIAFAWWAISGLVNPSSAVVYNGCR